MPQPAPPDIDLAFTVRAAEYERFLCIQLASPAKRAALYAVTAYGVELARIAETVSEPLLGHIRFAWWREALEEIAAGAAPRNHPVVLALAALYAQHPQVWPQLLRMAEARAADLDTSLLAEEAAWLDYLDGTAGALHAAWAMILDANAAEQYRAEIINLSRVYGMLGLARAIPYMAAHGFLRFPQLLIPTPQLTELRPGADVRALVEQVIARAKLSQSAAIKLPKSLAPLTGLLHLARYHQRVLEKAAYDPYALRAARLSLVLRIIQVKFFLC